MEPVPSSEIIYSEIVRPPAWLFLFTLFLTESMALSLWAAFDNRVGTIAFVFGFLIAILARTTMAMKIEVTKDELRIGRAHIDRRFLDEFIELDSNQMALTRGRDANPAAFLAIRFWQPLGIKVTLQDKRDPTPYWLITSKTPAKLTGALKKN